MVTSNELPGSTVLNRIAAQEMNALALLGDKRPTQVGVAKRLRRSQAYVSEQWRGRRPLEIDVIEATALEAGADPVEFLLALSLCVEAAMRTDVGGMEDRQALDAISVREPSGGAYALAARRREQIRSKASGGSFQTSQ